MTTRSLLFILLIALLGGCKIFKGKTNRENIEPPVELTDISNPLDISSRWTESVGDGEGKLGLRQAPAVSGSRLFVADVEGNVEALGVASGDRLWQVETELRISGGPGEGEGTLVVGTLDGEIVAFNPDNGSERWRAKVSSEVIAAPTVARGLVIVRSNDGRVFAFGALDGERKWVYDRGLPSLTLRGNSRPVVALDRVFVGYDNGVLVALKIDDGSQLWEQPIAQAEGRSELERMVDIDGDLAVAENAVIVASYDGQVMALDPASGRPLWNREMSVFTGISLAGEKLLVTDESATVWALDRHNGASLWRQDALAHRWLTTPAVQGDFLVVGDLEGYLHWLRLDTGEIVGRERIGRKPIRAVPQIAGDSVIAINTKGKIAVFAVGD